MKEISLIITIIILLFLSYIFWNLPEGKTSEQICLEKGGIQIMNWNNSDLKNCIFNNQ